MSDCCLQTHNKKKVYFNYGCLKCLEIYEAQRNICINSIIIKKKSYQYTLVSKSLSL